MRSLVETGSKREGNCLGKRCEREREEKHHIVGTCLSSITNFFC